jgi:hypothetical protein
VRDRLLVARLIEIGVTARRRDPNAYAMPSDDSQLSGIGAATIATWLEELGRRRLIGDVQPCFTRTGAGFRFQVTDEAVHVFGHALEFDALLDTIFPPTPEFDLFISYAAGDSAVADESRNDLESNRLKCFMAEKESNRLKCFMAEKDIQVATEWQDSIRAALIGSKRILVLLTPRSINRPWVLLETGAAWALCKPLIPALVHVATDQLPDPIRRYQARVIETTAQRQLLVNDLVRK